MRLRHATGADEAAEGIAAFLEKAHTELRSAAASATASY